MKSAFLKILVCSMLAIGVVVTPAQQEDDASVASEPRKKAGEIVEIKSVFEEPSYPSHIDPFFPQSKRIRSEPTVIPTSQPQVATIDQIFLKGVSSGADGKRIAIINRKNFAAGESGTVQTPRGPVNIEVLEVKESSAVIKVENDPDPKEVHMKP